MITLHRHVGDFLARDVAGRASYLDLRPAKALSMLEGLASVLEGGAVPDDDDDGDADVVTVAAPEPIPDRWRVVAEMDDLPPPAGGTCGSLPI